MKNKNQNSENWYGILYFNREDSRVIVPKRVQGMGWTLNFGNTLTYVLIAVIIGLIIIFKYIV